MTEQSEDFAFLDGEFQVVHGSKVTKLLSESLEKDWVRLVVDMSLIILRILVASELLESLFLGLFAAVQRVFSDSIGIRHNRIKIFVGKNPKWGS